MSRALWMLVESRVEAYGASGAPVQRWVGRLVGAPQVQVTGGDLDEVRRRMQWLASHLQRIGRLAQLVEGRCEALVRIEIANTTGEGRHEQE